MNWWAIAITAPVLLLVVACISIFIYICIWFFWGKFITDRQKKNCYDCIYADRSKSSYILCYHPETALHPYHGIPSAIVGDGDLLFYEDGGTRTIIHRCDCWKWDRIFSNLKWKGKATLLHGKACRPKKVRKGFNYF